MESLGQLGNGLLIVGGALLCGVLILIGGILVAVLRSGLIGDVLQGLGGAVGDYEDEYQPRSRSRSGGSARSRVQDIRSQYDREFDTQIDTDYEERALPAQDFEADLGATSRVDDRLDRAAQARRRRRRSQMDDYDDEMDAFFDDMEL